MRKKILILSSSGGYGHKAAVNTLKSLIGNEYDLDVEYPILDLKFFKLPKAEEIYNFTLKKNWYFFTNWYVQKIAPYLFLNRESKTINIIKSYIEKSKPDLLISLIPFVTFPATEAALLSDIPLLVITIDNDLTKWVLNMEKARNSRYKITIGADLPSTRSLLLERKIPNHFIETTGLPLRPEFHLSFDKEHLKKVHQIPAGKKVVMIMLGGMGGKSIFHFAKEVAESQLNVHILVCTGKNKNLAERVKTIQCTGGNSLQIVPFTDKIHEFFAVTDLILTKPGPGTINEAFCFKIPILIDKTKGHVFWEEANIDLVLSYHVGACIEKLEDTSSLIKQFLFDEKTIELTAKGYETIPTNGFCVKIKELIAQMV